MRSARVTNSGRLIINSTPEFPGYHLLACVLAVFALFSSTASATTAGKCTASLRDQKSAMERALSFQGQLANPSNLNKGLRELDNVTLVLDAQKIQRELVDGDPALVGKFLNLAIPLAKAAKESGVPLADRVLAAQIGYRILNYLTSVATGWRVARIWDENFMGLYSNLQLPEAIRKVAFEGGDQYPNTFNSPSQNRFLSREEILALDTPEFSPIPYREMNPRQQGVARQLRDYQGSNTGLAPSKLTLEQMQLVFRHATENTALSNHHLIRYFLSKNQSYLGRGRSSARMVEASRHVLGWKYLEQSSSRTTWVFDIGGNRILTLKNTDSPTVITPEQFERFYQQVALGTGNVAWDVQTNRLLSL